jgi:hypothetical protein
VSADGYRFSAKYLKELEDAVNAKLQPKEESVFIRAATDYADALAAALERPAGHPIDPSSTV